MGSLFDRRRGFKPKAKATKRNNAPQESRSEVRSSFSKNTLFQVERISHDGRGVAHHANGKLIFISGALPAEQVKIKLEQAHERFDEAVCTEVVKASEHRVEAPCSHFSECGGCQLQYATYAHQLELKQQIVAEQLQRSGINDELPWQEPLASPTHAFGYRRRLRLAVAPRTRHLGFRAQHTKDIVEIHDCPVAEPTLNRLLPSLQTLLKTYPAIKTLGHIELGLNDRSEHEIIPYAIVRAIKPLSAEQSAVWKGWQSEMGVQVIVQDNLPEQPTRFYALNSTEPLEFGYLTQNRQLRFGPNEFIQVNRFVNEKMVQQAIAWLQPQASDKLLELFAGFGNFTLALAPHVKTITAVEAATLQIERGKRNAQRFHFSHVQFLQANLAEQNAVNTLNQETEYNLLLLDPPRAGALEFCRLGKKIKAERILYISCNPDTLARDLGFLIAEAGFEIEKISVIDMFAQTFHVETMVLLKRTGKANNSE